MAIPQINDFVFGEQLSSADMNAILDDLGFLDGRLQTVESTDAAIVATGQNTTSTSYTDLSTSGPAVTITVGASGTAICWVYSDFSSGTTNADQRISPALSGANTVAAADTNSVDGKAFTASQGSSMAGVVPFEGLTPGSTTFTLKYKTNAGTATFANRKLVVSTFD